MPAVAAKLSAALTMPRRPVREADGASEYAIDYAS